MEENGGKQYIAIDLKSFYASVECVSRGLDPLTTNLVVADESRTEKTICLAVSPSLKAYGISGRARLYEVVRTIEQANREREKKAPGHKLTVTSVSSEELAVEPKLKIDYIAAPPRMAKYVEVSTKVVDVYLRYIAPEDIHVYSIDEVFIDATMYLKTYNMTARELAMTMIREVLKKTGITATAGIGTNLYLSKIAMDIVAKKMPPDEDGVRIAELDEMSYRKILWDHRPLTDFWRVGRGISAKLEKNNIFTMGDIALLSTYNEDLLYNLFGVGAELLIDHAWGYEPCEIKHIKAYKPENRSISSGQVLSRPYEFSKAKLVTREMTELLSMDLFGRGLVADQMVLTVCYDINNMHGGQYTGQTESDAYGRTIPKKAHGSINLGSFTSSTMIITEAVMKLFDDIVDRELLVRRMYVVANHVKSAGEVEGKQYEQLDMFTDDQTRSVNDEKLEREKRRQKAMLEIREKYGKNAILKGFNFEDGATAIERNSQIGGHKA